MAAAAGVPVPLRLRRRIADARDLAGGTIRDAVVLGRREPHYSTMRRLGSLAPITAELAIASKASSMSATELVV